MLRRAEPVDRFELGKPEPLPGDEAGRLLGVGRVAEGLGGAVGMIPSGESSRSWIMEAASAGDIVTCQPSPTHECCLCTLASGNT